MSNPTWSSTAVCTIRDKRRLMVESLVDKEYRDAFVAEHIATGIAFQIRAMRASRGWSQEELAERTGKKQETISQLENPDYGSYTLKTLKQLASAFDVALVVRFAPFSELVDYAASISQVDLEAPPFEHDWGLHRDASVGETNVVYFQQLSATVQGPVGSGQSTPTDTWQSARVVPFPRVSRTSSTGSLGTPTGAAPTR